MLNKIAKIKNFNNFMLRHLVELKYGRPITCIRLYGDTIFVKKHTFIQFCRLGHKK